MRLTVRALLVCAVAGLAACSSSDSSTGPKTPAAPTGLVTSTTIGDAPTATIKWAKVAGASGYIIQRATGTSGGTFVQLGGTLTDTTFTDNTVVAGTSYRYRVAALNGSTLGTFSSEIAVSVAVAGPKIAFISSNITTSRTLKHDTLYVLSGFIKVQNGATLTIEPGTTIVGDTAQAKLGSSLWILRGAKIIAEGTAAQPIVMTSWYRYLEDQGTGTQGAKPGDWGGLIIIGNGIINRTGSSILTEGTTAGQAENYAGGTDNDDNSGSLRYVRIEFAGFDVSNGGGQELNSVSSYAVGRGTKYEYVQTMSGLDDSFEFWGGAVDGRYLVSYESGDDHYDWTEGYSGHNQFLIAFQTQKLTPRAGAGTFSSDPRLFEGDGCDPAVSGCTVTATATSTPYSMPLFANFTVVGPGQLGGFPTDGNGAVLRRGTGGTFLNGMILRAKGIAINERDAFTDTLRMKDSLYINGIVLAENGASFNVAGALGDSASMVARIPGIRFGTTAAALVTSLNPTALDWRPVAASLPTTGGVTLPAALAGRTANFFGGTFANTTFIGAVDPAAATPWYQGWTRYVIQ